MTYNRGGVTGTFSGVTTFLPLEHATRSAVLQYKEDGEAILGPEKAKFQASKLLLWDCAGKEVHHPIPIIVIPWTEVSHSSNATYCVEQVQVFFDESRDRSPNAILEGARFFHHIDVAEAAEGPFHFEHPCLADMYRGTLYLADPLRFQMLWHVSGPNKDGKIESTYTRLDSIL